jgi:hypothetical protein
MTTARAHRAEVLRAEPTWPVWRLPLHSPMSVGSFATVGQFLPVRFYPQSDRIAVAPRCRVRATEASHDARSKTLLPITSLAVASS